MTTRLDSSPLIIFEGPDGAGKTTAIHRFLELHPEYLYVHHGSYPHITTNLARLYADSMTPAAMGLTPTVMDRCWLSEVPYGKAYRDGKDRLGTINRRHLERLALRCDARMILCLPPYEVVEKTFLGRRSIEYLEKVDQLRMVYEEYGRIFVSTDLPTTVFDYTRQSIDDVLEKALKFDHLHTIVTHSAGARNAPVLIVGEQFAERKNEDGWYQWPFASLSGLGCSQWLTNQLEEAVISESSICWVNADELEWFGPFNFSRIIALGNVAHEKLRQLGLNHDTVPHPQSWKRFHYGEPYQLIDMIMEVI